MSVRLDKWLQVARVFKTRTQAGKACGLNRVRVNGHPAKAHRPLSLDDRIEVRLNNWTRVLIVRGLRNKPVPRVEARELYEDLSPPRPKLDPIDRIVGPAAARERGSGRPSKRDRRRIDELGARDPDA